MGIESRIEQKNLKMGFYYNEKPGFYYNQKPGFYYNEKPGFYYNQKPGFYYNQQQKGFYYNQQKPGFYYDATDNKDGTPGGPGSQGAVSVQGTPPPAAFFVPGIFVPSNGGPFGLGQGPGVGGFGSAGPAGQ